MYLLDTNHCSRIIFGEQALIQQLQVHSDAGVATSIIVCGELFYMARLLGLNDFHPAQSNNPHCLALLNILEPLCHPICDRTG
ncbi:MAG: hypothetical protein RIM23_29345 [Coleofasciculus sp. G3-WIS-01]|uniref:hypothetical protein n=1 Tax=Coleofasciculus sp. G3-WIS-01 TaxID=3069528 RepID=UPI0032F2C5D1